jgi:glycosyltransferase involved in cell wall biosynthesis
MKLLAISEHFYPRTGGTVSYVHETLSALVRQGVDVELWVPGPAPADWLPAGMPPPLYEVVWIEAGYPACGDPTRVQRYTFCAAVNDRAQERAASADVPDILHVVFGVFVMEVLDTEALRRAGLPSVATVHNVPPQECRLVAPGAPLGKRFKEEVRLQLVGWKNRTRLGAHRWDKVIVPSDQVRDLLAPILRGQDITVISHGPTGDLIKRMVPPLTRQPAPDAPVRLLTVGGYAPHKRQHLAPKVATRLRELGVDFEWDVVGPAGRVGSYFDGVFHSVAAAGLSDRVHIRAGIPIDQLAALYDAAHLYVQPSIEEGFCITALDAAAAGLPVIASPAGALARIAEASSGAITESKPESLAQSIADFVAQDRWGHAATQARFVQAQFSWESAAEALRARYAALAPLAEVQHV